MYGGVLCGGEGIRWGALEYEEETWPCVANICAKCKQSLPKRVSTVVGVTCCTYGVTGVTV